MSWKPFLRQIAFNNNRTYIVIPPARTKINSQPIKMFICSGPWTLYFTQGLCYGMPTVMVPQMRRENQTIDEETASWLPTTYTYSGIPWLLILSALTISIGRKKSHILVCICTLIGFVIFFFSTKITYILIGEIFQGALFSSCLTTCIIILTEYVSPKYRGIFLTLKSATLFWGITVANVIGTFFHWQNIAILGISCSIYTLLNVTVWPESPLWLASKGRFEERAAAHRWVKGEDEESETELKKLLKLNEKKLFTKHKWSLQNNFNKICRKQFVKFIMLSSMLVSLYAFCGKLICAVYAIEILKKITGSESTAYTGMLILDGVTVICMYIGCFISKLYKRKVLLMTFSILGIIFMILISGYLYFVKLSMLQDNKYISLVLLIGYSISICCGPIIMSASIIAEMLPLDSRILSAFSVAFCFKIIYGTVLKISPLGFKTFGVRGMFALFAVFSSISLTLIHFYLPETKDKTLQEIDECLKGEVVNEIEESVELVDVNVRDVKIK